MNLVRMEYFMAVADKLSYTNAAKMLFLSQPALSKQISLLEEELGVRLFNRTSKKVELTSAGIQLRKDIQEISGMIEKAKKNAKIAGEKEQEKIHIDCFDGMIMEDYLPEFLDSFHQIYPQVITRIKRKCFLDIRKALEKDESDLIFTLDFEMAELYSYQTKNILPRKTALIYSDVLFSELKESLSIQDFEDKPLITINPDVSVGCYRHAMELIEKLGMKKPKLEIVENFQTAITYLEMGYGYIFLSEHVTDRNERLKKISLPFDDITYVIAAWKKTNKKLSDFMNNFQL